MNKIFTFYSFKGGVGRSMALTNIAELLYRHEKRVIIIDWDLEAPGLEGYFFESKADLNSVASKAGLIDILETYKNIYPKLSLIDRTNNKYPSEIIDETINELFNVVQKANGTPLKKIVQHLFNDNINYDNVNGDDIDIIVEELDKYLREEGFRLNIISEILNSRYKGSAVAERDFIMQQFKKYLPSFIPFIQQVRTGTNTETGKPQAGLWLLTAGMRNEASFAEYVRAVQDFNWAEFYELYNGKIYFDWMREELINFADIILIDSRTGVTEMGGVCTRHLSDTVVLLTAPNPQNISGIEQMIKSITRAEIMETRNHRPLAVIVIPSRLDNSEIRDLNNFQSEFKAIISKTLGQQQATEFWDLRIPYVPYYTYHEGLVAGARTSNLKMLKHSNKSGDLEDAYLKCVSYIFNKDSNYLKPLLERKPINPFVGPKPFQASDTQFFFGRTEEIGKMIEILTYKNLLIITGPSGSGKTSTVNAGLIPALKNDACSRNESISTVIFRVGNNPVKNLKRLISDGNTENTQILSDPLSPDSNKKSVVKKIVFIDQLEEIFIYPDNEKGEFFSLLNLQLEKKSFDLIVSVRIDYYKQIIKNISPAQNANDCVIKLDFLNENEIRKTIFEPANKADIKFEEGLVERILKGVENSSNKLPAVQLILSQLWLKRNGDLLTHAAYDQVTKEETISQTLENSSKIIPPQELESARPIITRLVNIETRTRLVFNIPEFDFETTNKVKPFVDAGLLILNYNETTNSKTIELSHDILITQWPVLRTWIERDVLFYTWRQRLDFELNKWETNDSHKEYLLKNTDLREAKKWLDTRREGLMPDEKIFIKKSLRLKREKLHTTIAYFVIVVGILGGYAFYQNFQKKKAVKTFTAALVSLEGLSGKQRQDSICSLSNFDNLFEDEFIKSTQDSLSKLCYKIQSIDEVSKPIIDSNNAKLAVFANEISSRPAAKRDLDVIDSIELMLNRKKEAIVSNVDQIKKQQFQRDSAILTRDIENIYSNNPLLKDAYQAKEDIVYREKKKDSIINKAIYSLSPKENLIAEEKYSNWFKENYFLQFKNIQITLIHLHDNSINVIICDRVGLGNCANPIVNETKDIQINVPYLFNYAGNNYSLTLDKIGRAGKNPFKLAAFITFKILTK